MPPYSTPYQSRVTKSKSYGRYSKGSFKGYSKAASSSSRPSYRSFLVRRPATRWTPTRLFRISQTTDTLFSSSVSVQITQSNAFSLQNLDQFATFALLFDQYRLIKVTSTWTPRVTMSTTIGTAIGASIYSVVDYNDQGPLAGVSAAREYDTCKEHGPYETWTRSFVPKYATSAYSGSAFSGYAQGNNNTWIDISSTGIPYYSLKVVIPACTAVQTWDVKYKLDFEFQHVR
uniref:Capsid protein n=1 Tax=Antarctic circular DNA molecule TaxID=2664238 RepID=A0A5Q2F0C5_9ZZZZ|nr:hypothetical protein [Antarctic circular DNA molecule]